MIVLFFCFLLCVFGERKDLNGTVYYNPDSLKYEVKYGILDNAGVAWGKFDDSLNSTGWGLLELRTNSNYRDDIQMFAAGFLEGKLTAHRIWEAQKNLLPRWRNSSSTPPEVVTFLLANDAWITKQVLDYASDPFWRHVGFLQRQFHGIVEGYQEAAGEQSLPVLTELDFQILQATCDVDFILQHLDPTSLRAWETMTPAEWKRLTGGILWPYSLDITPQSTGVDHCSALVKLTPDFSDLLVGHDTWGPYRWMNRIYKLYMFDLQDRSVKAKALSFSSFPGGLYSQDNFYITSEQLAIVETTNRVFNNSEFRVITPESLLPWIRVRVANMLADNGHDWTDYASTSWSGTTPNQWVVVDYKKFSPFKPLQEGALWIMEEIPSLVHAEDMTAWLERGDWWSFNIAFFEDISNMSCYPPMVERFGTQLSYALNPRAKIYRRDVGKVRDLDTMKSFMLYNDWKNDPFSEGSPANAIASRQDLDTRHPLAQGSIDTKLTTSYYVKNMIVLAKAGPTTQGGHPPFEWTNNWSDPHWGQPPKFDFDWVEFQPTLFSLPLN